MRNDVLLIAAIAFAAAHGAAGQLLAPGQLIHGRALQPVRHGASVRPLRYASLFDRGDGSVGVGAWREFNPPAQQRGHRARALYDCLEFDLYTGIPAPDCPPYGCAALGLPCEYYTLGPDFHNPLVAADFVADGRDRHADGFAWAWWWGAGTEDSDGNGIPDEPCYIAVLTFDGMNTQECADSGSDFLSGGLFYFGVLDANTDDFYSFHMDAGSFDAPLEIPADGEGGFQMLLARDFDPNTGELTFATLAQPVLYATDDDEPPGGSIRIGTQNAWQFDDVNPTDGVLDPASECFEYSTGSCPTELGPAMAFYIEGSSCICPDFDGSGEVDLGDLGVLLSEFGHTGSEITVGCADLVYDFQVNLADLAVLLANFGRTCL